MLNCYVYYYLCRIWVYVVDSMLCMLHQNDQEILFRIRLCDVPELPILLACRTHAPVPVCKNSKRRKYIINLPSRHIFVCASRYFPVGMFLVAIISTKIIVECVIECI